RRPDRVLPDRRAPRPGAAVADRQGEAAAMAVSSLTSTSPPDRPVRCGLCSSSGLHVTVWTTTTNAIRALWLTVRRKQMSLRKLVLGVVAGAAIAVPGALPATAADTVFFPLLVYRTGPYAPSGIPVANGFVDYFKLLNERDGGIGGAKVVWEECETAYDTKLGVECYERLKGKHGGAL